VHAGHNRLKVLSAEHSRQLPGSACVAMLCKVRCRAWGKIDIVTTAFDDS